MTIKKSQKPQIRRTLKEFLSQNDLRNSLLGLDGAREVPDYARKQSKVTEMNMSHYLLNQITKPMLG